MPIRDLDLTADSVTGPWRWRWVLTDAATGERLAEHTVAPDPERWEVTALADLEAYLAWRAEPDRRVASEAELLRRIGAFLGQEVLGPGVLAALRGDDPVRLRIHVAAAPHLTGLPLELAGPDGRLPARISFRTGEPVPRASHDGPLRMLAVFSLPTGTTALRLRSERQRLTRLIEELDRPVELEVVQWGVTRDILAARLAEDGGPDLLHLSGHGSRGRILLEGPDGEPDEIGAEELVALIRPARDRLRLAFLSACESGMTGDAAGLGVRLAGEIGCTVLAMRYPVTDDVAGDLAEAFYRQLIHEGRDAGDAAFRAVRAVAGAGPTASRPALSLAAPVLIGPDETTLDRPAAGAPSITGSGLPPEPELFVGRDALMTAANAALRPGSGTPVLLLTGMAAVGKTTCAVELAHRHAGDFGARILWAAPERDAALADGPAAFASAIGPEGSAARPPAVAGGWDVDALLAGCDERRALLILDNAESLLTGDGRWADPRWAELIAAVAAGTGPTRLVITSRVPPAGLAGAGVRRIEVGPLSGGEADALMRQLPGLRTLLHIDDTGAGADRDRALVGAVKAAAGGHPRLLELADAAASDPDALSRLLRADLGDTLAEWTRQAVDRLDSGPRLLLRILAAAEPGHRSAATAEHAWSEMGAGRPPFAALEEASLTRLRADGYEVHPAVAEIVRSGTPAEIGTRVETVLAEAWELIAREQSARGDREDTGIVVAAHLAAVPYLLRLDRHARAAGNLNAALIRDAGPRVARMALPLARALAVGTPARDVLLGLAYQPIDPDAAERYLRAVLANGDDDVVAVAAGALANQLFQQGRLDEATELAGRARRLGDRWGPWTRAGSRLRELAVLAESGRSEEVLTEVTALLASLPEGASGEPESVVPWAVRESAHNLAVVAALGLERWEAALDHNGRLLDSVQRRGAREAEVAHHWFNDAAPLIRLGRFGEARRVLDYCGRVFDEHHDDTRLSRVLGTRALLAAERGDPGEAAELERAGLRLAYRNPELADVATGHLMLGNHLRDLGTDPAGQLAHHLAAALLRRLGGAVLDPGLLGTIAADLHTYGQSRLPDDAAALTARVERVPGVRFHDLATALTGPDVEPGAVDDVFRGLLDEVRREATAGGFDVTGTLLRWDSRIPVIAAAAAGEQRAARPMEALLRGAPGPMATAIRAIVAGERDLATLAGGVHPADVAVLRRALAAIAWAERTGAAPDDERFTLTEADYHAAVDENDQLRAGTRAAELSGMLRGRHEYPAALRYADLALDHDRRAGFGPWKLRFDLGRRLQLLGDLNRPDDVLAELEPHRPNLRGEPDLPSPADPVNPSTVREDLLTLGRLAASALGEWEVALSYQEDRVAGAEMRGVAEPELAELRLDRVRFLIDLGRREEARTQLGAIRAVLVRTGDPAFRVAIASYDEALATADQGATDAVGETGGALAEAYRAVAAGRLDPRLVAQQHVLAGERLGEADEPARKAAHLLAAAVICGLAGDPDLAGHTVRHAAPHLYQLDGTRLSFTLTALVTEVERWPGVRFTELVTRLGTTASAATLLTGLVRAAYAIPAHDLFALDRVVSEMAEEIAAVVAAATGGPPERTAAEESLARLAEIPDMRPLIEPLRRAAAGQPPADTVLRAVHPIHAAVLAEVRTRMLAR
ncbi:CHAT domain-containing protein [Actinoplanes sp. NPDC051851]|uniref:CHAT domain-containing protein n=1 Tax=Actinoplanes sp. NPDC051851 TaxID=3154753 RepID=UPI0034294E8A